jgi:hypothetical protein
MTLLLCSTNKDMHCRIDIYISIFLCEYICNIHIGIPQKGVDKGGNVDILEAHSMSVMNACMDRKAICATRQSFTQCLRHAHGNPYSVRSCALQATLEGMYMCILFLVNMYELI